MRSITCPLLVIRGDDDFLVSRANALELVERVPGARLLNLPFGTHSLLEEEPSLVISPLKAFMNAAPSASVSG